MDVAIIGGTGTLGRHVATELTRRGHHVRVLSRRAPEYPVDLTTGEGLAAALDGVGAVVNAANGAPSAKGRAVLIDGTRRLLEAEQRAGVEHHVDISIVGCDRVPFGYYRVKHEQEAVVVGGPVPWTIVRATQFHELVDGMLTMSGRWHVLPSGRIPLQTVAAAEVGRAVADVAEGEPQRRRVEVAGPQVEELGDLAGAWRAVTGRRAVRLPVPAVGGALRAVRGGALTTETPDVRGTMTFTRWLEAKG